MSIRQGTSFPERSYKTFVLREGASTRVVRFGYGEDRPLISGTTIVRGPDGSAESAVTTSPGGGSAREIYVYDGDRLGRIDAEHTPAGGPPTRVTHHVEYTEPGAVAAVITAYENGYRNVAFKAPKRLGVEQSLRWIEDALTAAVPPVASRVREGGATVKAVVLGYDPEGAALASRGWRRDGR